MKKVIHLMLVGILAAGASALAQGGGPVAEKCKTDIEKFCPGKEHKRGQIRSCLEANKNSVTAACKEALESTGPGKGKGAK